MYVDGIKLQKKKIYGDSDINPKNIQTEYRNGICQIKNLPCPKRYVEKHI